MIKVPLPTGFNGTATTTARLVDQSQLVEYLYAGVMMISGCKLG